MKVIKVSGCNVCPYVRRHMERKQPLNEVYCSAVEDDYEGYGMNIRQFVNEQIIPEWCPLEEANS